MPRIDLPEGSGAFLRNDRITDEPLGLRSVWFQQGEETVHIRFRHNQGEGGHTAAINIPIDRFINLCKEFIEAQSYSGNKKEEADQ
jgi:hypothetical protein